MAKKITEPLAVPTSQELEQELERVRHQRRYFSVLRSTVFSLISASAIVVLICVLVMPVLRIYGSSMEPTLTDGDIVICLKNADFTTGDLIGFYYNNKILVKRVIATSGDWVNIDSVGNVSVNDHRIDEPYIYEKSLGDGDITFPYQVPENRLFVLGDHRATSVDSRSSVVGCASQEQVVGKIVFRIWPLSSMGFLN